MTCCTPESALSAATGRDPRSLSFTTTMQLLVTNWLLCAVIGVTPLLADLGKRLPAARLLAIAPIVLNRESTNAARKCWR